MRSLTSAFFAVLLVFVCAAEGQTPSATNGASDAEILAPLLSRLRGQHESVKIELRGGCSTLAQRSVDLDLTLDADPDLNAHGTFSGIKHLFRSSPGISIDQKQPRRIDVRSQDVWTAPFAIKLSDLHLDRIDRYNPDAAIDAAIGASVKSLRELHAATTLKTGGLREVPSTGRPHLPSSTVYETLGDLLDDILRVFDGVLVYKECEKPDGMHVVDISFYRTP